MLSDTSHLVVCYVVVGEWRDWAIEADEIGGGLG